MTRRSDQEPRWRLVVDVLDVSHWLAALAFNDGPQDCHQCIVIALDERLKHKPFLAGIR